MASEQALAPVRGLYLDGRRSSAQEATLSAREGELILSTADGKTAFAQKACRLLGPLGRLNRIVELPGGARFETSDDKGIAALFQKRFSVDRWEASWRSAGLAGGGFLAILLFGYFVALPLFSRQIADRMPPAWKRALSIQARTALDKGYLSPSALSAPEKARAEEIFRRVKKLDPTVKLELRASKLIGANALALPDGTIFLTDELFHLAKSDDEILGVLYHEAAHVSLNHATAEFVSSSVISLALFTIAGNDFGTLAFALLNSSYSRNLEAEADTFAARELKKEGRSPAALGAILGRMEKEKERYKYLSFLSTHPDTKTRIERLNKL